MAGVFYFPLLGTPTAEGYQLSFYEAGTDVPLNVWTDSDLTIPFAQPIIFNADGNPDGPIYVSTSPAYKVVYQDADGVAIPGYPVDFVSPSTITNVITTSTTTLTNAQIKALPTTPITLIAAPGSGVLIQPTLAVLFANCAAGAYTNINSAGFLTVGFVVSDNSVLSAVPNDAAITNPDGSTRLTDLLGTANNRRALLVPSMDTENVNNWGPIPNVQNGTTGPNTALTISIDNNGAGALTGGNAANTLTVVVTYQRVIVP